MKRKYEIIFIIEPQAEEKTKESLRSLFQEFGGNLLKEEELGLKTLAYKVKKRDRGYYYLVQVELPPDSLKKLNAEIRLNESILKYMALILKERKEKPKPPKKKSKPRADREPSPENAEATPQQEASSTAGSESESKEPVAVQENSKS